MSMALSEWKGLPELRNLNWMTMTWLEQVVSSPIPAVLQTISCALLSFIACWYTIQTQSCCIEVEWEGTIHLQVYRSRCLSILDFIVPRWRRTCYISDIYSYLKHFMPIAFRLYRSTSKVYGNLDGHVNYVVVSSMYYSSASLVQGRQSCNVQLKTFQQRVNLYRKIYKTTIKT